MAQLAVGDGEFGGAALQRFIQLAQLVVGLAKAPMVRFKRREGFHEKILRGFDLPLALGQNKVMRQHRHGRFLVNLGDVQDSQAFADGFAAQFVGFMQGPLVFRRETGAQERGVFLG